MNKPLILLLILLYSVMTQDFNAQKKNEGYDSSKTIAEYLISYGYNFEEHKVPTPDGYILTLWRIPKKIGQKKTKRQPILLQHGVLDNSFSWLFKRIDHNFGTILVDEGYDVWLGNNRGTIHSLEHANSQDYNWKDISNQYWDFSFDQMGAIDFPAMIDYICDNTGYDKVMYAGHSQGAVQFFIKGISDPEYVNTHIHSFIAFAPVVYIQNPPGRVFHYLRDYPIIDSLYHIKMKNFFTFPFLKSFYVNFSYLFPALVRDIIAVIAGNTKNQTFDYDRLSVMATCEVAGTSTQNLMHWVQLMRGPQRFEMFDFGKEGNLEKYGLESPPTYNLNNLRKVTVPMLLIGGNADNIQSKEDFEELLQHLPSGYQTEHMDDYGHLDSIWSDDAHVKLYPKLLSFLKKTPRDH